MTTDHHLIEGSPASAVRVVVYENLQCGDCQTYRLMLDSALLPRFGAAVAFEHRDFPLPKHNWARLAAAAARYFDSIDPAQGVQFRRRTLAQIKQLGVDTFLSHVSSFAAEHGQSAATALAAIGDPRWSAAVEADYQEGVARGVVKTPTVYVQDRAFIEIFTEAELSQAIQEALAA
ncbi:MAG: hypothetical protein FJW31_16640 [Acidobacteria bacterium]|nr:hypothetical protein [Acidobacteriota bacterium]